jgi:hypothetical protein
MKRIMAMVIFQTRRDAERAADALDEAGYELNIREDIVDPYSAATFMEAWRHVGRGHSGGEERPSPAKTIDLVSELNRIWDDPRSYRRLLVTVGVRRQRLELAI